MLICLATPARADAEQLVKDTCKIYSKWAQKDLESRCPIICRNVHLVSFSMLALNVVFRHERMNNTYVRYVTISSNYNVIIITPPLLAKLLPWV